MSYYGGGYSGGYSGGNFGTYGNLYAQYASRYDQGGSYNYSSPSQSYGGNYSKYGSGPLSNQQYGLQNATYHPQSGGGSGGGSSGGGSGGGMSPQGTPTGQRQQPPNYRMPSGNQTQVVRGQNAPSSATNMPGLTSPAVAPQGPYVTYGPQAFPFASQGGGGSGGFSSEDFLLLGVMGIGALAILNRD